MIRKPVSVFGILGYPIAHTLSPAMHNAAFRALDMPGVYLPFEVHPDPLKEAVGAVRALGIRGMNVTRPHKEAVIPYLDRLSVEARKIGAVNTIEVARGTLVGHNTDGMGFLKSLADAGVDPAGIRVILLGAGGAARGVAVSLLSQKISELIILSRSGKRGHSLMATLNSLGQKRGTSSRTKISLYPFTTMRDFGDDATLLVNTTPLGMRKQDPVPYPLRLLHKTWIVADLIYAPLRTPLLSAAERIGAKPVSGIGMLIHQAAIAFNIWTKKEAPIEAMRQAVGKSQVVPEIVDENT